jgi:hypothetical protein
MRDFITLTPDQLKHLKYLALDVESLEKCPYQLDSDELIKLREAKEELYNFIKNL